MSTDAANDGDRMEKIDVRVPASLLEGIEEEYARRGYSSRSEAIRDALRDWLNPPVELSEAVLDEIEASREGESLSLDEAAQKYDVDLDEE